MRTDLSCELDQALSGRDDGKRRFQDVARSGNGNMRNDLIDVDAPAVQKSMIPGLGFVDISSDMIKGLTIGALAGFLIYKVAKGRGYINF